MPPCSPAARASAFRAALTRDPCPTLRAMADWKASGRGASNEKSTRLPAASTTGLGLRYKSTCAD